MKKIWFAVLALTVLSVGTALASGIYIPEGGLTAGCAGGGVAGSTEVCNNTNSVQHADFDLVLMQHFPKIPKWSPTGDSFHVSVDVPGNSCIGVPYSMNDSSSEGVNSLRVENTLSPEKSESFGPCQPPPTPTPTLVPVPGFQLINECISQPGWARVGLRNTGEVDLLVRVELRGIEVVIVPPPIEVVVPPGEKAVVDVYVRWYVITGHLRISLDTGEVLFDEDVTVGPCAELPTPTPTLPEPTKTPPVTPTETPTPPEELAAVEVLPVTGEATRSINPALLLVGSGGIAASSLALLAGILKKRS